MLHPPGMSLDDRRLCQFGLVHLGLLKAEPHGNWGPLSEAAYTNYLASCKAPDSTQKPRDDQAVVEEFRAAMVKAALSLVGKTEQPPHSNRGPEVEMVQASTWLAGTGWAYCAATCCWAFLRALEACGLDAFAKNRPRTAGARDFENWAQGTHGVQLIKPIGSALIMAGDFLIFGNISHIGIAVENATGSKVRTMEGNTNDTGGREGDGFWRKDRKRSDFRSIVRVQKEYFA